MVSLWLMLFLTAAVVTVGAGYSEGSNAGFIGGCIGFTVGLGMGTGCFAVLLAIRRIGLNHVPTFSTNDIADLASLSQKLKKAEDPVSVFLFEKLSSNVQAELAEYESGNINPHLLRGHLMFALNAAIEGPSIFADNRFSCVQLRPKTRQVLMQQDANRDATFLNRLLLEDAYPDELCRTPLRKHATGKRTKLLEGLECFCLFFVWPPLLGLFSALLTIYLTRFTIHLIR